MKPYFLILSLAVMIVSCKQNQSGDEQADPYLWLEEIQSEQSLEWIRAQNETSEKVLRSEALFESLRSRYISVFNEKDRIAYPNQVGDYVYNFWDDETNERGLWRRMPAADYLSGKESWETVLDLDELSARENKKWVFKGASWLEPGNTRCLISLSDGGKDKSEVREFDAVSKSFVDNGFYLEETKGGAGWIDENTLLVAADFGKGSTTTSGYPRMVKIWERGTSLEDAAPVYETDSTITGVFPFTFYSHGRQYSAIYVGLSTFLSELHLLTDTGFRKLSFPEDARFAGFFKNQVILSLQSDWERKEGLYSAGSLVSFDLDDNLRNEFQVTTIYQPDQRSSFESMSSCKDFIVVNTLQNVQNKLSIYRLNQGKWEIEALDTPDFGSIFMVSTDQQSNDYFFNFSNLITSATLYHGNEAGFQELKQSKAYFNADNLTIKQHEAISKDGTRIPYFIVHQKDMELNGQNPTLIYAYGGFNSSELPYYSSTRGIGWLEQGGVYVLANIRGGGEFGPEWHKAAMKEKRQNAYDDFYAVSEDLIDRQITSPAHLGAYGWSNGGLLAGVVLTQRPEMYNAVVVGAPLLDMKRYSKMLAGASWMGEYGDPDIAEDWAYLKKYSPYHNVKEDGTYPEALFITSISDDRVHPGHARKMVAKMMEMGHPVLYHETLEGGHGAATTNSQQADMWAMMYTYLNIKLMP